jgi:pyruvate, water dikinase
MTTFWHKFDFLNKKRQQKALQAVDEKELFIKKYRAFREVLRNNNEVLLAMGDMQEKTGGAFVFDRAYVRSAYGAVSSGIKKIIENLNILADDRYQALDQSFQRIEQAVLGCLEEKVAIPETGYIRFLEDLRKENLPEAGGKFAFLGEIAQGLDLPVPAGFVITTHAYKTFMRHNHLEGLLQERLKGLDLRNYEALQAASDEITALVQQGQIPSDIGDAILEACLRLRETTKQETLKLSVRSSAIQEDIIASFAGQYESLLNVSSDDLLAHYLRVLASLFTPRALVYYRDRGFAVEEMAMAVGVLAMVDARASGVAYSRDPQNPSEDILLISAAWGLGLYAVQGAGPMENWRLLGRKITKVIQEEQRHQTSMVIPDLKNGTRVVPVPPERIGTDCLSVEQILELASYARRVEKHLGRAQDVEWALDSSGRLFLLQARPLRLPSLEAGEKPTRSAKVGDYPVLLNGGTVACPGVGAGPVFQIQKEEDLAGFPEGGVLVIRHTYPEYAVVLNKAVAVVSDSGSSLSHLATVAREYNVPALFNTGQATQVLTNGMKVTVDALYAVVYEGLVSELLQAKETLTSRQDSPAMKQLRDILPLITPLSLTDPRSPEFAPNHCRTIHDITRFAHEVSLRVIFDLSKESHFVAQSTRKLEAKIPLSYYVIDLEDGVATESKGKSVRPDEILSLPMRALWEGMIAIPWQGPPPVDTKGFLSVVQTAMMDPSIDPATGLEFGDRNYILISKNFCNVSTRLGFHFSTIEGYIGDQENENYISFVYTGGGAEIGRRTRRIAMIAKLLETFDFRIERKEDTLFARCEGYPQTFIESRLKVLGHIIIHTRQMDMVMFNDAMVDWYYQELMKDMRSLADSASKKPLS